VTRVLLLIAAVVAFAPARAVILYGTGDPSANTSAPTGALANSGWQFEGQFGGYLGTVIASNYFITAKHIGGNIGDTFTFNGTTYTTTAVFPDPASDLQIWQVAGSFPIQAPLYSGAPGSEVNLGLAVFGRGTQRGDPVFVGNDSHLGGWLWGAYDGVERWGTNVVGSIFNDSTFGQLLRVPFDNNAGVNEAHLSAGDSGGAVFIFNSTTNRWELAGINLGVDGRFSTSSDGANPFEAAMFDTVGLFEEDVNNTWVVAPNPSTFYATEIAAHRRFVESVVMQLTSVVSQKTHGTAGTFDVNLPSAGVPGIECRSGGGTNDYAIVFTFANNVSVHSAAVTMGTGGVTNFLVVGNVVTVNLTGVTNAQTITITLGGVSDGINTSNVEAAMSVLLGDVDGSGRVDSTDVSQIRQNVLQTTNSSNFRSDVDASGRIDSNDVFLARQQNLTGLPSGASSPTSRPPKVTPLPLQGPGIDRTYLFNSRKLNRVIP